MNGTTLHLASSRSIEQILKSSIAGSPQSLDHAMESICLLQELLIPITSLEKIENIHEHELQTILDAGAYISMVLCQGWLHYGIEAGELLDDVNDYLELRMCRSTFLDQHPELNYVITVYPVYATLPDGRSYVQIPGLDLLDMLTSPLDPMPYFARHTLPLTVQFQMIEHYFLGALLLNSPYAMGNWRHEHSLIKPEYVGKAASWWAEHYLMSEQMNDLDDTEKDVLQQMVEQAAWPPIGFPGNESGEENIAKLTRTIAGRSVESLVKPVALLSGSQRYMYRFLSNYLRRHHQELCTAATRKPRPE